MSVSIGNNSDAGFCEECVLWRVFGIQMTAAHSRPTYEVQFLSETIYSSGLILLHVIYENFDMI